MISRNYIKSFIISSTFFRMLLIDDICRVNWTFVMCLEEAQVARLRHRAYLQKLHYKRIPTLMDTSTK
jgi:hypothetical protein